MSETNKTITFAGVALFLLLLAFVTAPGETTPDAFSDQGEPFFPEFTDPNTATTLEVIEFDSDTGAARPFKVTFNGDVWTIPSHHDYPADGKDRLAKTAAGVISLRKEDYRSSNVADQEAAGVLDPLDETLTSLTGRGKRVTIKDASGEVLADIIIGNELPDREGYHFVRIPDQKRIYVAKADFEISTRFADWIEKDLLEVNKDDINQVTIRDYSINERTGVINQRGTLALEKHDSKWEADRMASSEEVDSVKMNDLLKAVDELSIVGVRPKPEGLSTSLKRSTEEGMRITQADMLSLQSKGFYFSRDGNLLSNEGELEVQTNQGLDYVLRFGEILYGTGEEVSAGSDSNQDKSAGPGENRYLFITASFQEDLLPKEPKKPSNMDFQNKKDEELTEADKTNKSLNEAHEAWAKKLEEGRKKAQELNERFSGWYYVINSDSFDKIHVGRSTLIKKKS